MVFQLKIFTLEFLVSPGSRHVGEGDIVVVFFTREQQIQIQIQIQIQTQDSPGSRHIGEGDIVVSNAAKARQDLGERCHDKVLAMPANGVLIDVDSILYLYWERGGRGGGVVS